MFPKLFGDSGSEIFRKLQEYGGVNIGQSINTSKTFYVDATNGDDNNTGASDSPFKSLTKAINSAGEFTTSNIYIIGDYTLNEGPYIYITNKVINLYLKGIFKVPYVQVNNVNKLSTQFFINNSNFSLNVFSNYNAKLLIGTEGDDTTLSYNKYYGTSLFITNSLLSKCSFAFKNYNDNNTILEVGNNACFLYVSYDTFVNFMFCCSGTGRESVMGTDSTLVYNVRKTFITCSYDQLGWKDTDGNSKTIKDFLIGFSKDSNGVPQNYIATPYSLI